MELRTLCQGRLEFAINLFHTFTRDIPNNPYIDIINEIIQKLESEEQPDEDIDFDEFLNPFKCRNATVRRMLMSKWINTNKRTSMEVTSTSVISGKTRTIELPITEAQMKKWLEIALIQDAFPNLTPTKESL